MNQAQQEFNNKIIEIANKIYAIRRYSYGRRGLRFDHRNPDKMLSIYEKQDIDTLHNQMKTVMETFKKWKIILDKCLRPCYIINVNNKTIGDHYEDK